MKRYPIALAAAALAGAALQYWCRGSAFDPATGLVERPLQPALLALWGFYLAVPVLALLAALPLRGAVPPEEGLYGGFGPVGRGVGVLGGLLLCAAGALRLAEALPPLLAFLRAGLNWGRLGGCAVNALLCAGGAGLVWLALGRGAKGRSLAALLPGFGVCFWLVVFYHNETRDPVLARYVWTLLALMAAVLALYHQAAWGFGRPAPVRTQWFTLTAGVWALAALPGAGTLAEGLGLAGLGCWMGLMSEVASRPAAPWAPTPQGASPAQEGTETAAGETPAEAKPAGQAGGETAPKTPEGESAPAEESAPEELSPEQQVMLDLLDKDGL